MPTVWISTIILFIPHKLDVGNKIHRAHAHGLLQEYEVVSKIFRAGAAIYTAVVVAQIICRNRPNCEFGFYCEFLRRLRENV
jgi:hypothetical protein